MPLSAESVFTPPSTLGLSLDLKTKVTSPSSDDRRLSAASISLFSPLLTPITAFSHSFSEEATGVRVFPVEMFLSVRKDAAHTPHGVLKWSLRQYQEVPTLKVPAHLHLSMNEVTNCEDGVTRGAMGAGLKGKTRLKPVRHVHHKVMSVLSRLTEEKYAPLLNELLQLPLRQLNDADLQEVVKVFFDKAIQEPSYSSLYARLVKELCTLKDSERELELELREGLLCNRIHRLLMASCKEQFCRPIHLTHDEMVNRTTGTPLGEEEIEMKRLQRKRQLVGNVKFVGELFKIGLVTEHVIEDILYLLVGRYDPVNTPPQEDYVFEVFSTLIHTVGFMLKESRPSILCHCLAVAKVVEQHHPRSRIRFLMMNLGDSNKKAQWAPLDHVLRESKEIATSFHMPGTPEPSSAMSSSSASATVSVNQVSAARKAAPAPREMPSQEFISAAEDRSNVSNPSNSVLMNSPHFTVSPKPHHVVDAAPARRCSLETPPPDAFHPLDTSLRGSTASSAYPSELSFSGATSDNSGTPLSRVVRSPHASETVNMREVVIQMIRIFKTDEGESTVIRFFENLTLKIKVVCLTWWLRSVSTHTSSFDERDRVLKLFSVLLTSCPTFKPTDLLAAVIEWLRFDIEKAEYSHCPRMLSNISRLIFCCYSPEMRHIPRMEDVRRFFHVGIFNIMLHGLATGGGRDQILTMVRDAYPISLTLFQMILDPADDAGILRGAVENRFWLLPPILLVSGSAEDKADAATAKRSCTSMLDGAARGDTTTSAGRYDPLSQCISFPGVSEDPELIVFCAMKGGGRSRFLNWRDEALRLALLPIGNGSLISQLVQAMKVVGAVLVGTGVSAHDRSLASFTDVDWLVSQILACRSGTLFEAALVMELVMHFSRRSGRHIEKLASSQAARVQLLGKTFGRWCATRVVNKAEVMTLLRSLDDPSSSINVYTTYHNCITDPEIPWAVAMDCLSSVHA
jgi:hypothetical protein